MTFVRTCRAAATMELAVLAFVLSGCGGDPVPRPRGWLRLDLPAKAYAPWAPDCPFTAEVPAYARMEPAASQEGSCWFNMRFPGQRATVHLTYKSVDDQLARLVGEAHDLKSKHEAMATRIESEHILRDTARVYGTLFDVDGDVASPMVFYLTDSTAHFLYGALYFNAPPNADSLAPVTERIREDVRHFAATLRWRDGGAP